MGLPEGDPLVTCAQACPLEPEDGFDCRHGMRVPHAVVCDGVYDCGKGEDELNCTPYVCADGQEIEGKDLNCDNTIDCNDGSDEKGCPFSCGG